VDVDVVGHVLPGVLEFSGTHAFSSLALVGRVRGTAVPMRDLASSITGRSVRECPTRPHLDGPIWSVRPSTAGPSLPL
jgi:hypothetical protein